ncbi:MAG: hypothetical protein ACOYZ8_19685 [Chloroflexota bacterium]
MKVNLGGAYEFECFDIEEAKQVEKLAEETNGVVYSWKTEGRHNWFQKGFTVVDVLGLTVLPKGLLDWIDLPEDKMGAND